MFFALRRACAPMRHHTYLRRLRVGWLVGLAFTVSACASNSGLYPSYSLQAGQFPDYYLHGYYGPAYGPQYYPPNYPQQPDWRTYGRHHDTYPWLRVGPNPPLFETRRRIERERYYQLQKHRERMLER